MTKPLGPQRVYADAEIVIDALLGLGSMGNNVYLLRPASGGPVLVVDAPEGSEATIEALGSAEVSDVVLTHSHRDHWAGHEALRGLVGVPISVSTQEVNLEAVAATGPLTRLDDGAILEVGSCRVRVIHTPGHTPGSICLLANGTLITGDTLFPGGPGYSRDHGALLQEILSITGRLFVLPDETLVLPGHGPGTTIGAARAEHAAFAAREHAPDLHGDVLWASS
ncbi:MAG: MBL fold metallo-hydrolase [Dehalococcoidia bacterium]|nr:MBL fold metallo-hydrolase [Dehalococcoidia bacterium]